ncbi:BMC domain-containing protein [Clostridium sp. CTA-5]
MQALGLIETRGLIAAIEGADIMLKSANVSFLEKTYVGGGLVSVAVTGDVGAVKAAVEAGVVAIKKLDSTLLVSDHVIPRPHEELNSIIGLKEPLKESKSLLDTKDFNNVTNKKEDYIEQTLKEIDLKQDDSLSNNIEYKLELDLDNIKKSDVDDLVNTKGIDETIKILSKLKVSKLRALANQYDDFKVTGGKISKASKKLLIREFKTYYE